MAGQRKWEQVVDAIRRAIASGELAPDQRLPSEAALSRKHSASRPTIRNALLQLEASGLIRSHMGSGWYVRRDERLRFPLSTIDAGRVGARSDVWGTFLERNQLDGRTIFLRTESVPAPPEIARRLKLGPGEHAVGRHRIRTVNGEPVMLSTGWFPSWLVYGSPLAENADMQSPSPLAWLIQHGYEPVRDEDEIGSCMPTIEQAETLHLPRGTPVIVSYRTSWDARGRPIRLTADVFRSDKFWLVTQHVRHQEGPPS